METFTLELTEPELWRIQSALNSARRAYVEKAGDWQRKGRDDRAEIAMELAADAEAVSAKLRQARMERVRSRQAQQ